MHHRHMSHLEPKTSLVQTQKKSEGLNDCGSVLLFAAAVLVVASAMMLVG